MKTKSKSARLPLAWVIAVTAGMGLVFMIGVLSDLSIGWNLVLLGLLVVAMVWMVVRILKDLSAIDQTFNEYFYQDRPDIDRNGRE